MEDFLQKITGAGNDLANVYSSIKGAGQPAPVAKPAPVAQSNANMFLLIGGGALALVLILVFALRK